MSDRISGSDEFRYLVRRDRDFGGDRVKNSSITRANSLGKGEWISQWNFARGEFTEDEYRVGWNGGRLGRNSELNSAGNGNSGEGDGVGGFSGRAGEVREGNGGPAGR